MHIKNTVVQVRVQWIIMETLKHPACTVRWAMQPCCSWLSPGKVTKIPCGRNPNGIIQLLQNHNNVQSPLAYMLSPGVNNLLAMINIQYSENPRKDTIKMAMVTAVFKSRQISEVVILITSKLFRAATSWHRHCFCQLPHSS